MEIFAIWLDCAFWDLTWDWMKERHESKAAQIKTWNLLQQPYLNDGVFRRVVSLYWLKAVIQDTC